MTRLGECSGVGCGIILFFSSFGVFWDFGILGFWDGDFVVFE